MANVGFKATPVLACCLSTTKVHPEYPTSNVGGLLKLLIFSVILESMF